MKNKRIISTIIALACVTTLFSTTAFATIQKAPRATGAVHDINVSVDQYGQAELTVTIAPDRSKYSGVITAALVPDFGYHQRLSVPYIIDNMGMINADDFCSILLKHGVIFDYVDEGLPAAAIDTTVLNVKGETKLRFDDDFSYDSIAAAVGGRTLYNGYDEINPEAGYPYMAYVRLNSSDEFYWMPVTISKPVENTFQPDQSEAQDGPIEVSLSELALDVLLNFGLFTCLWLI